jgi:predicted TIM-barrel fold metal-dependent hydrolase
MILEGVLTFPCDGIIIDPWNELEHARGKDQTQTEFIGASLTKIRRFARQHQKAIFICAHPSKMRRDKDGKFVMIDDPRFDPVIDYIEKSGKTLVGHLGEPRNAWLPVDQMTVSGDKNYFSKHPEYHMFLHPEYPSYEDQVNARDKMLERHPNIRFVGVHLGSLEWSVDELAKRLDKFPNMAVDMAERICHLEYQSIKERKKVRDFMIKYQDRLIYATDDWVGPNSDPIELKKDIQKTRLSDWKYFVTDEEMNVPYFKEKIQGLKLPKAVIDKIYRINAEKWFPGI